MKFENLKNSLKTNPQPCYYLIGQDDFLISSAINSFTRLAGSMQDFNVTFIDAADAKRVVDDCMLISLMGGVRVVIVRGLSLKSKDEDKGDKQKLKDYLKNPNKNCILVFVRPSDAVIKCISDHAISVECDKVSNDTMLKYIMRETDRANRKISEVNALKLIEMCGTMSYLALELKKLCYYGNDNDEITQEVIEELIEPILEYKIFELSDAIHAKDTQRANEILNKLLQQKFEPTAILSMLYNSFRRLFYSISSDLSETEISAAMGVKPYAITMAKRQAQKYSPILLRNILSALNQCEFNIKSGKLSQETAIRNIIFELCTN